MCGGKGCPIKDECFRHTAKANEYYQAFFVEPPFRVVDSKVHCDMYWGNNQTTMTELFEEEND